jgi:hypothetical protein
LLLMLMLLVLLLMLLLLMMMLLSAVIWLLLRRLLLLRLLRLLPWLQARLKWRLVLIKRELLDTWKMLLLLLLLLVVSRGLSLILAFPALRRPFKPRSASRCGRF